MSRSYKKNPITKDHNKGMKQFANRAVRNYKGRIPNGKSYRKIFETWDISDYAIRWDFEEFYLDAKQGDLHRHYTNAGRDTRDLSRNEIYRLWKYRWLGK